MILTAADFQQQMYKYGPIIKDVITGLPKRMPGAIGILLKDGVNSIPTPQTVNTESVRLIQI